MSSSPMILSIVGPTASGKSALALSLARALDCEIVSFDSMQIYIGMDIGTAKPTRAEQALVKHHMIDICTPDRSYSCADYAAEGGRAVRSILDRGKGVILCGGTGLYLDSLLAGERFAPDIPPEVEARVGAMGGEEAYERLRLVDPLSAEAIHPSNEKRVRRALSIYLGTSIPKSEWDARSAHIPPAFRSIFLGIEYPDRERLYDRIDRRVDLMMEQGLYEEVRALDLDRTSTAGQAIGYKELYRALDGELSLDDAVALLKRNTRHYAKRQMTWFRRRQETIWLDGCTEADLPLTERALMAIEQARGEESSPASLRDPSETL